MILKFPEQSNPPAVLQSSRACPRIAAFAALWYNMRIMFDSDSTDDGFIIGMACAMILSDRSTPNWRWSDFLVYGAAALATIAVVGGISWLIYG